VAGRRKGSGAKSGKPPTAGGSGAPGRAPEQLSLPLAPSDPPAAVDSKPPIPRGRRAPAVHPNPPPTPRDRRAAAGEGTPPPPSAPAPVEAAAKAPALRVLAGGGAGAGHARGQLLVVGGSAAPIHLPDRAELDRVLLGALADLLAGRITPTAAAAIREAAVAAIRAHDHVDADPDRFPELVRAARALRELVGAP
jgi:hypothetical protein